MPPSRPRQFPSSALASAARLGALLLPAALALAAAGCGGASSSTSGIPPGLISQARPIGAGPAFHPPARGPVVGACHPLLGPRYGVHLEVFAQNEVVLVPAGIGTRPPRVLSAGRIIQARCYGSLVTLDPTGVILVRTMVSAQLGQLFRSWGYAPSSSGRRVRAYVDGRRWTGPLSAVPLTRHAEIVVEAGPYVPPHHAYLFPPGV